MRALFLLHGAPGSGKSTLVRRLGVEDLTVGYDAFRQLFSAPFPCAESDGTAAWETLRLTPEAKRAAVSAAHEALQARCAAGSTVFFDATNSRVADQTKLAKLAARYGYRTYLIDCQGDLGLEALLERNESRGVERVDEEALAGIHARCAEKPVSPLVAEVLSGTRAMADILDDIAEIAAVPSVGIDDRFSRILVVGDVHSCAEALDEAVEELDADDSYWVLAGDLFDRGPDPVGVWTTVGRLIEQGRATVVTGNHEINLRAINSNTNSAPFADTRATRDALLDAGIMTGEQNAFVDATVPMVHVYAGGEEWIVTHGGVGELTDAKTGVERLLRVSDAECVYGLGDRAHTYRAKTSYDVANMPLTGYQLHGHRNGRAGDEPVETLTLAQNGDPVICLESGVSTGGELTVAVLGDDRYPVIHRFDDRVDAELAARNSVMPWQRKKAVDPENPSDLLARMRASEHVKVRPVEGVADVVACNFTRRAFVEGAWDELTVHARGLFVDEKASEVVARGYEKFFHLDETPGRSLESWLDERTTAYPVALRKKYNGYLALVASIHGRLEVFSKSGVTDYSRFARGLLVDAIGEEGMGQLAGMLERTRTTAAFEAIAARDTHPVAESGPDRLVLLDCIRNRVEFATDEKIRDGIAKRFGFDLAETVDEAHGPADLLVALEKAHQRTDEGVVLVGAKGYRSKVKADAYAERKAARTALERLWRGASTTLGPRFAELERRLIATGILECIDEYTVTGVDGAERLDLAGVFDDLEKRSG